MNASKQYFCYLMASRENGAIYAGVTSSLIARVYAHREKLVDGFTRKYNIRQLVWYEAHSNAESAIRREKQLKKWNRSWKIRLIETSNPAWDDLYPSLAEHTMDSRLRGNDSFAEIQN